MPLKEILYFSEKGEVNSDETLKIAKNRSKELGVNDVIVASTRGTTGVKVVEQFKGFNVVVVPHVTGLREPGKQELPEDNQKRREEAGGKVVIAAHTFSGVNRAIQAKWNTMYPSGIIAQTLRMFGEGMKVVVEIAAMAVDAGSVPAGTDVLVIAGSVRGADTAVIMRPANSHRLFDTKIKEILAKPSDF
jgi:hypothetical protein